MQSYLIWFEVIPIAVIHGCARVYKFRKEDLSPFLDCSLIVTLQFSWWFQDPEILFPSAIFSAKETGKSLRVLSLESKVDPTSEQHHAGLRIVSQATQCVDGHCHVGVANSHFEENEVSLYEFTFAVGQ